MREEPQYVSKRGISLKMRNRASGYAGELGYASR